MDTATREYTAPFFSTVNSWLVGEKTAGIPGIQALMFSRTIISASRAVTHSTARKSFA